MTPQKFLELRQLISIAHHVPGRIRLKFDLGVLGHPVVKTLSSLTGEGKASLKEAGFVDSRLNLPARSLVLEYNPERISPQVLDAFFSHPDAKQAEALADQVAALLGIELQHDKESSR